MNAASEPSQPSNRNSGEDPQFLVLGQIAEQMKAAAETGESVDLAALRKEHPDLDDEIEGLAAILQVMNAIDRKFDLASEPTPNGTTAKSIQSNPHTLGDFRILREIGKGGMGVVYEAEQMSLGRTVALKVLPYAALLDERYIQRFQNEVRAAATLDHPHIVPVYGVGKERGVYYYAMKFVTGCDLSEFLDELRQGQPPDSTPPEPIATQQPAPSKLEAVYSTFRERRDRSYFHTVAQWCAQTADALHHAHENGVVHRDIKPSNLMVDHESRVWVTDFGLAHIEAGAEITATGDIVGTLRYMSPEQATGNRAAVDHRTDIFSLGTTLYELLTFQPAFVGKTRTEVLRRIAEQEPRSMRRIDKTIPTDLETIALKALRKSSLERYQTAQEMAEDLRRFLAQKPIHARPPGLLQRLGKWFMRRLALVAPAAAALVLITLAMSVSTYLLSQKNIELERQRDQAERQRTRALEHRAQVLAWINDSIHRWTTVQRSTRDRTDLRRQTLEQALAHYLEFAEQPPGEFSLHLEIANTFRSLAQVYFAQRRSRDALDAQQAAINKLAELADLAPNQSTVTLKRARALHELAVFLRAQQQFEEASVQFQLAVDQMSVVARENPGNTNYQRTLHQWRHTLQKTQAGTGRTILVGAQRKFTPDTAGMAHPTAVAFGPDGDGDGRSDLYVSDGNNHRVLRFSGETGKFIDVFVRPQSGGLFRAIGVAFGADANGDRIPDLLVSSHSTDQIMRYDGGTGKPFPSDGQTGAVFVDRGNYILDSPEFLTIGDDGHLYVACSRKQQVLRFDGRTGRFMGTFANTKDPGWPTCYPLSLTFGFDGNQDKVRDLYVSTRWPYAVFRFDGATGAFLDVFVERDAGGLDGTEDLTFGPDGNLFVSSPSSGEILRYDGHTGAFIDAVATEIEAAGLTFSPRGTLIAANRRARDLQEVEFLVPPIEPSR